MEMITGTPYAKPTFTFNDRPLNEQLRLHADCAKEADAYRLASAEPSAPVFLVAPEYTYCAHPRNHLGDVTHRFLPHNTKKVVLKRMADLSSRYPKVAFIFSVAWLKEPDPSNQFTEGRNTTYVYYGGEKIHSQHKNGDAGELLPGDVADGVRYREPKLNALSLKKPPSGIDGVFMVEGRPFGIETCCDFGCRLPFSLASAKKLSTQRSSLEGQFLISSTLDHTSVAEKSKKLGVEVFHSDYFFHADGRRDLWPSSFWNRDHFSKNLMGGYSVRRKPRGVSSCLEELPKHSLGNSDIQLSCYSVPKDQSPESSSGVDGEPLGVSASNDTFGGVVSKLKTWSGALLGGLLPFVLRRRR